MVGGDGPGAGRDDGEDGHRPGNPHRVHTVAARTRGAVPSEREELATLLGVDDSAGAAGPTAATSDGGDVTSASAEQSTGEEATAPPSEPPPEPAPVDATPPSEAEGQGESPVCPTETASLEPSEPPEPMAPPRAAVGWSELGHRFAVVGRLVGGGDAVAIDLDHPKAVGIFGYMGSGKSYLLGTLIESALVAIPGINSLPSPLAVVIFNYRRNAADRFELTSLALPNDDPADVERLAREYNARPQGVPQVRVLCLPGGVAPTETARVRLAPCERIILRPRPPRRGRLGVADGRTGKRSCLRAARFATRLATCGWPDRSRWMTWIGK